MLRRYDDSAVAKQVDATRPQGKVKEHLERFLERKYGQQA